MINVLIFVSLIGSFFMGQSNGCEFVYSDHKQKENYLTTMFNSWDSFKNNLDCASEDTVLFLDYIYDYQKYYTTHVEFNNRFENFKNHKQLLLDLKQQNEHTEFELNMFADLYEYEKQENFKPIKQVPQSNIQRLQGSSQKSIDWRTLGGVTSVKDQGQVGTCYTFSAVGAIETQYFLQTQQLRNFSEQQVTSCSKSNNICDGGLMDLVFTDLKSDFMLTFDELYPYKQTCDGVCLDKTGVVSVSSYVDVEPLDVEQFKLALEKGSLSIAIQADQMVFQFYKSGILTSDKCFKGDLDHGVLVVGYSKDEESGLEYAIVKNSWSSNWAQQGYIYIELSERNVCGLLSSPSYPLIQVHKKNNFLQYE